MAKELSVGGFRSRHLMGTCRMGIAERSVVNPFGRTQDVRTFS
jgi:choline dehydrogenase-like flavoprotein